MSSFEQRFNPEKHSNVLKSLLENQINIMQWEDIQYRQLIGGISTLFKHRKITFGGDASSLLQKVKDYKVKKLNPGDPQIQLWLEQLKTIPVTNNGTLTASIALLISLLTDITSTQSTSGSDASGIINQATTVTQRPTTRDQGPVARYSDYTQDFEFPGQASVANLESAMYWGKTISSNRPTSSAIDKFWLNQIAAEAGGTIESRARELYARGEYAILLKLIKESQIYKDIWNSDKNLEVATNLQNHYTKDHKHIFTSDSVNLQPLSNEDFRALVLFAEVMTTSAYSKGAEKHTFESSDGVGASLDTSITEQIQPLREQVRNVMMLIATFPDHVSKFTEIQLGLLNAILTNLSDKKRNQIISAYQLQHEHEQDQSSPVTDWRDMLVDSTSQQITSQTLQSIINQFDSLKIVNTYTDRRPGKYSGEYQLVRVTTAASLKDKDSVGIRWEKGWQGSIRILFARKTQDSMSIVSGSMQTQEPQKSSDLARRQTNQYPNQPLQQALARSYTANLQHAGDPNLLATLLQEILEEQKNHQGTPVQTEQNAHNSREKITPAHGDLSDNTTEIPVVDSPDSLADSESPNVLVEEVYYDLATGTLITGSFDDYRQTIENQLDWLQIEATKLSSESETHNYSSERFGIIVSNINDLNDQILELQTSSIEVPNSLTSQYETCLNICTLMLAELRTINTALLYSEGVEELASVPMRVFENYQKLQALFSYLIALPGYPAAFTLLYPQLTHSSFTQTIRALESDLGLNNEQLVAHRVDSSRKIPFAQAVSGPRPPTSLSEDQVIIWQDTLIPKTLNTPNVGDTNPDGTQEQSQNQHRDGALGTPFAEPEQIEESTSTVNNPVETTQNTAIQFAVAELNTSAKNYLLAFLNSNTEVLDQKTAARLANAINKSGLFTKLLFDTPKSRLTPAQIATYQAQFPEEGDGIINLIRQKADDYFTAILDSSKVDNTTIPTLNTLEDLSALQTPADLAQSNLLRSEYITNLTSALANNSLVQLFYIISKSDSCTSTNLPAQISNVLRIRVTAFIDTLLSIFEDDIKQNEELRENNKIIEQKNTEVLSNVITQLTPAFSAELIEEAREFLSQNNMATTIGEDADIVKIVQAYLANSLLRNQKIPPLTPINVSAYPEYLQAQLNSYSELRDNLNTLISAIFGFTIFTSSSAQLVKSSSGGETYVSSMPLRVFVPAYESLMTSPAFVALSDVLRECNEQLRKFELSLRNFDNAPVLSSVDLQGETQAFLQNSTPDSRPDHCDSLSACLQRIIKDNKSIELKEDPQMLAVFQRLQATLSSDFYKKKLSELLIFICDTDTNRVLNPNFISSIQPILQKKPLDALLIIASTYYHIDKSKPLVPSEETTNQRILASVLDKIVPFLPTLWALYDVFGGDVQRDPAEANILKDVLRQGPKREDEALFASIKRGLKNPEILSAREQKSGFESNLFAPIHTIPAILSQTEVDIITDHHFWSRVSKAAALHTDTLLMTIQKSAAKVLREQNPNMKYLGASASEGLNIIEMQTYTLAVVEEINRFKKTITDYVSQGDQISNAEFAVYTTILFLLTSIQHSEAFEYLAINNDLQYIDITHFKMLSRHCQLLEEMIQHARNLSLQQQNNAKELQFTTIINASILCASLLTKLPDASSTPSSPYDLEQAIAKSLESVNFEEYTLEPQIPLKTQLEQSLITIPDLGSKMDSVLLPHIKTGASQEVVKFIGYYRQSSKTIADTFGILKILFEQLNASSQETPGHTPMITDLADQANAIYSLALMADDQYDSHAHEQLNNIDSTTPLPRFDINAVTLNADTHTIHDLFKRADIPSFFKALRIFVEQME